MAWNCQFHRQGLPVSSLRTVSFITENSQFHHKKLCGTGFLAPTKTRVKQKSREKTCKM